MWKRCSLMFSFRNYMITGLTNFNCLIHFELPFCVCKIFSFANLWPSRNVFFSLCPYWNPNFLESYNLLMSEGWCRLVLPNFLHVFFSIHWELGVKTDLTTCNWVRAKYCVRKPKDKAEGLGESLDYTINIFWSERGKEGYEKPHTVML